MATSRTIKPQISREQIVDEALLLLQETSLAGLKMRVLGERMGIKAASLYWHFPNKAALLAAMSETLFLRALENVEPADDWQSWMRSLGRSVWDNLLEIDDSGLLIMSAELSKEQFERTIAAVRVPMEKFDIDQEQALRLHSGIQALMIGWVTFAHSEFIQRFEDLMDTRGAALETLDAMIAGWEMQMASKDTALPRAESGQKFS